MQFTTSVNTIKGLSIIHINCRSLNANFVNVKIFLENLDFSFDIIALSETWLYEMNTYLFHLGGIEFCHKNLHTNKGEGVTFFIRSEVNYRIVEQLTIDVDNCFECITVKLLLKKQIIISCLYRKPNGGIVDFTNYLESMFDSPKNTIYLCRDFSIEMLNYNVNNMTKYFVDKMYTKYFLPLINKPTCIANHLL